MVEAQSGGRTRKLKTLTNEERKRIHCALLKQSVAGKVKKCTLLTLASSYSVSLRTIQRIWK